MKFLGIILVIHAVICAAGALLPFYPPILVFYWYFPGPFFIKLCIIMIVAALQLTFGGYLLIKRESWKLRWFHLVIISVGIAALILIIPMLKYSNLIS